MRTQCGCTRSTPSCRLKCSKFAVLGEKVRPHHEDREGHEGFVEGRSILRPYNFVLFASFVVNIFREEKFACN